VIVDPDVKIKNSLDFNIFIDATMPKIKTNIKKTFADLVIGIGPGYTAGKDVHIVIETNNTDRIGTWLKKGKVDPDTKIPLEVGGFTFERVLRNKTSGIFKILKDMGSIVQKGDEIARVGKEVLIAEINGCVRALMRNGVFVGINTKLGEIDPRPYPELCKIIRPRMRNISGGVLESILYWFGK
jgi:xanthine dehydrogenase accessory factor